MGQKGDKSTSLGATTNDWLLEQLTDIEGISSKKMFGGYGVFHDEKMFAMINSKGQFFLRADATTNEKFIKNGGERHSKMPYFTLPESISDNNSDLLQWVNESIQVSKKPKK